MGFFVFKLNVWDSPILSAAGTYVDENTDLIKTYFLIKYRPYKGLFSDKIQTYLIIMIIKDRLVSKALACHKYQIRK